MALFCLSTLNPTPSLLSLTLRKLTLKLGNAKSDVLFSIEDGNQDFWKGIVLFLVCTCLEGHCVRSTLNLDPERGLST